MNSWNFLPNTPEMVRQYDESKAKYEQKNAGKSYDEDVFAIAYKAIHAEPLAYLQFGVYWWAVKSVMKSRGYVIEGDVDSPALNIAYTYRDGDGAKLDQVTIYAAFMFREWFIDNCFITNRESVLDNDTGEVYYLIDEAHEVGFVTA